MINPANFVKRDYSVPKKALNRCHDASYDLAEVLRSAGVEGVKVVSVVGIHNVYDDDSPAWRFFNSNRTYPSGSDYVWHYVTRVGSVYVDLTARQFWPRCPHPLVLSADGLRSLWDSVNDEEMR